MIKSFLEIIQNTPFIVRNDYKIAETAERMHAERLIEQLIFWKNGEISYRIKATGEEFLWINNINVLKNA
jgi:hypothetical protein